jgi:hypothetical protein
MGHSIPNAARIGSRLQTVAPPTSIRAIALLRMDAREIGQAVTLMYTLVHVSKTHILCTQKQMRKPMKLNDFSRAHAREKSSSEQTCNHNQRLLKFKCGLTTLDSP